jgi:hypothetical protein
VTASYSLTVLSRDADASCLPFGEKVTALIRSEWPSSVCSNASVATSHSLTVSLPDTDATLTQSE